MLFNSLTFLIFFIIVYSLYLLSDHKRQNLLLLVASYFFYGWWDWRFIPLLFLTTFLDFVLAQKIFEAGTPINRKALLVLSIVMNLGVLGFFKYYNFFASNADALLAHFGSSTSFGIIHVILPIGISFYTFQSMSYVIDVYRGELVPPKSFRDFGVFVTYFPHLVAGPILRATHILPQVLNPRKIEIEKFYEGGYLIFWGLFQKVCIADKLGEIVSSVFSLPPPYNGIKVLIAIYAFAFQILCDFSGYSDIARGLGKLMGFDIVLNFNLPYFATNPREFWKRWHISLSTWLRDYLYVPLGGNKKGEWITCRNLMITMLLGGLWHGAAWTFVIWGAYHGFLLIGHRLIEPILEKIPKPENLILKNASFLLRIIFFFHLVCLGWLFFRAQSMYQAFEMMRALIEQFHFEGGLKIGQTLLTLFFCVSPLLLIQYFQRIKDNLMIILSAPQFVRVVFYVAGYYILLNSLFGRNAEEFIYFQF